MRIAIMGSGGTGGYFGARLAKAGFHVTFIARGAHYQAMLANGLRVSGQEEFHLPEVRVVQNPMGLAPVDVVIFAVKAYDTDGAAEVIRPLVGPQTTILPIQNGIDSYDRIGAVHGYDKVIGGLCRISAEVNAPGVIRVHSDFRQIMIGEMNGEPSIRVHQIANLMAEAGIDCRVSGAIQAELWKKFIFITALSGVCGAARSAIGPIREVPEALDLYRRIVEEGMALAWAAGVSIEPDYTEKLMEFARNTSGSLKASLLVDLERGRPTEVETLQGAALRLGRQYGVPTPVTEVAYALIKLAQGA